jgi:hypothetical protein
MYCKYYQAKVLKDKAWFVSGCLRAEENLVFARSMETKKGYWEFFVPQDGEAYFLEIMNYFLKHNYIQELEDVENRLKD